MSATPVSGFRGLLPGGILKSVGYPLIGTSSESSSSIGRLFFCRKGCRELGQVHGSRWTVCPRSDDNRKDLLNHVRKGGGDSFFQRAYEIMI